MRAFLEKILPQDGIYCLAVQKQKSDGGKFFQHYAHTDLDLFCAQARQLSDKHNIYYAMGSLIEAVDENGKTRRTQSNIDQLKSFWLDLDCGEGKDYATQSEAVKHLKQFVVDLELPKPTIVSSGRGVHVYWSLSEPIDRDIWDNLAPRFKAVVEHYGLKADHSCTSDCSRVLRVPDTLNHKDNPPKPVVAVSLQDDSHLGQFLNPLKVYYEEHKLSAPPVIDKSILDLFEDVSKRTDYDLDLILEHCNQMKLIADEGGPAGYQRRASFISIAKMCKDVDYDLVEHGDPNPETVEQQTDTLIRASLTDNPHTCTRFEEFCPGGCDGCQYKGLIKSPIRIEHVVKVGVTEAEAAMLPPDTPVTVVPEGYKLTLPENYFTKDGKLIHRKDVEGEMVEFIVHDGVVDLIEILEDANTQKTTYTFRVVHGRDAAKTFSTAAIALADSKSCAKMLADFGILGNSSQQKLMADYMVSFVNMLKKIQKSTVQVSQLGWNSEYDSFVLPTRVASSKESDTRVVLSEGVKELSKQFEKVGTLEAWRETINVYAQDGYEGYAFGHLSGYGSILLSMTQQDGALISMQGNSGSGKSTVLKSINSIFGKSDTYLTQIDTPNSKFAYIGFRKNICSTFDEISNIKPEDISDLAYSITQGRAKHRLNADASFKANNTTWCQFMVCSTNHSLIHKLANYKSDSSAEALRIFEYALHTSGHKLSKIEADDIFDKLDFNYGHAGDIYIDYVVGRFHELRDRLRTLQREIDIELNMVNNERYWSTIVACNLLGGEIAKELGLHNFNMSKVRKWACDQIQTMRLIVKDNVSDPATVLNEFINTHVASLLIVGRFETKIPNDKVYLRFEEQAGRLYIDKKYMREYVTKKGGDWNTVLEGLKEKGAMVSEGYRIVMTKGTNLPGSGQTMCIVMDAANSAMVGVKLEAVKLEAVKTA